MKFDVITLFPDLVKQVASCGVTQRAQDKSLFELKTWNPRDYTDDVHRTVDDRPYGGGPGMVMLYQPLLDALQAARKADDTAGRVAYLSPQGRPLTQGIVNELALQPRLILVSGRYEGVDERFIEAHVDEEYSVGDYVLSGGELPAMLLIDAIVRQLPGALGHAESAAQDSFMQGLLDCPHYSRPEEIDGHRVPDVLLSGHHARIAEWRRQQALKKTLKVRPELLTKAELSQEERQFVKRLKRS